jgi:hypothetical protein
VCKFSRSTTTRSNGPDLNPICPEVGAAIQDNAPSDCHPSLSAAPDALAGFYGALIEYVCEFFPGPSSPACHIYNQCVDFSLIWLFQSFNSGVRHQGYSHVLIVAIKFGFARSYPIGPPTLPFRWHHSLTSDWWPSHEVFLVSLHKTLSSGVFRGSCQYDEKRATTRPSVCLSIGRFVIRPASFVGAQHGRVIPDSLGRSQQINLA